MGAQTVAFEISVKLRMYARDESVDLTLRLGGIVLGTATIASAIGLAKLVAGACKYFSRLPLGVQLMTLACLVGILLHQATRERLVRLVATSGQSLMNGLDDFIPIFLELAEEASQRHKRAIRRWSEIEPHFPPRRIGIGAHALAVCAAAGRPLTFEEIVDGLGREGASTTARTFRKYLRTVLRNHPSLERAGGTWTVIGRHA